MVFIVLSYPCFGVGFREWWHEWVTNELSTARRVDDLMKACDEALRDEALLSVGLVFEKSEGWYDKDNRSLTLTFADMTRYINYIILKIWYLIIIGMISNAEVVR